MTDAQLDDLLASTKDFQSQRRANKHYQESSTSNVASFSIAVATKSAAPTTMSHQHHKQQLHLRDSAGQPAVAHLQGHIGHKSPGSGSLSVPYFDKFQLNKASSIIKTTKQTLSNTIERDSKMKKRKEERQEATGFVSQQQERETNKKQPVYVMNREHHRQEIMAPRNISHLKKVDGVQNVQKQKLVDDRQKKMDQRALEARIATEMRQTVDDLQLLDTKPLPDMDTFSECRLSCAALADCVLLLEFLHTFVDVLNLVEESIPSLGLLQAALVDRQESACQVVSSVLVELLRMCLCDPGVPNSRLCSQMLGQRLNDLEVDAENCSEVLRMFMVARNGSETKLSEELQKRNFDDMSADEQAAMLAFLVNELMSSKLIAGEIDRQIEQQALLRRDRWIIEGKIRKLRTEQTRKFGPGAAFNRFANENNSLFNLSTSTLTSVECKMEKKQAEGEVESEHDSDAHSDSGNLSGDDEDFASSEEIDKKVDRLTLSLNNKRAYITESSFKLRGQHLGQDRFHRHYWALAHCGGIFVEGLDSGQFDPDQFIYELRHVDENDDDEGENIDDRKIHTQGCTEDEVVIRNVVEDLLVKVEGGGIVLNNIKVEEDVRDIKIENSEESTTQENVNEDTDLVENTSASSPEDEKDCSSPAPEVPKINGYHSVTSSSSDELDKCVARASLAQLSNGSSQVEEKSSLSFNGKVEENAEVDQPSDVDSPIDLSMNSSRKRSISPVQLLSVKKIQVKEERNSRSSCSSLLPDTLTPSSCSGRDNSTLPASLFNNEVAFTESLLIQQAAMFYAAQTSELFPQYSFQQLQQFYMEQLSSAVLQQQASTEDMKAWMKFYQQMLGLSENASLEATKSTAFLDSGACTAAGASNMERPVSPVTPTCTLDPVELEHLMLKELKARNIQIAEPALVPKELRNAWWQLRGVENLRKLNRAMHHRGIRERELHRSLQRYAEMIQHSIGVNSVGIFDWDWSAGVARLLKVRNRRGKQGVQRETRTYAALAEEIAPGDEGFAAELRLLEAVELLEDKTLHLSLQCKGWQAPAKASEDINVRLVARGKKRGGRGEIYPIDLARDRLLQLEVHLERRYMLAPFCSQQLEEATAPIGNGSCKSAECNEVSAGLLAWRAAVRNAATCDSLLSCLKLLESGVAWDKSIMRVLCQICRKDDNEAELLLCDDCDRGYHTYCFRPALKSIPDGEWFCFACLSRRSGKQHCVVCGKGTGVAKMASCDSCSHSYHLSCISPALSKVPRKWLCIICNEAASSSVAAGALRVQSSDHSDGGTGRRISASNDSNGCTMLNGCNFEIDSTIKSVLDDISSSSTTSTPSGVKKRRQSKMSRQNSQNPDSSELLTDFPPNIATKKKRTAPKKAKRAASPTLDVANDGVVASCNSEDSNASASISSVQLGEYHQAAAKFCLEKLMSHEHGPFFCKPVNNKLVPIYRKIIKRPMDFSTIKKRLVNRGFHSDLEFLSDVRLVFDNCETFNEDDSDVGRAGHELRLHFEELWLKALDSFSNATSCSSPLVHSCDLIDGEKTLDDSTKDLTSAAD